MAGKDGKEFIRFTVAAKDPLAEKDEKPTYYTCRMAKTGVVDKTLTNLDVWVQSLDAPQLASGE